jgi:hypothetical protein
MAIADLTPSTPLAGVAAVIRRRHLFLVFAVTRYLRILCSRHFEDQTLGQTDLRQPEIA